MNESPFSPGLEPEKHLFSVLVCHFPPKSYHETANLLLGPRALGSVDSEKFPMDWPWRGSRLGHSVHGQKSKKKKRQPPCPGYPAGCRTWHQPRGIELLTEELPRSHVEDTVVLSIGEGRRGNIT